MLPAHCSHPCKWEWIHLHVLCVVSTCGPATRYAAVARCTLMHLIAAFSGASGEDEVDDGAQLHLHGTHGHAEQHVSPLPLHPAHPTHSTLHTHCISLHAPGGLRNHLKLCFDWLCAHQVGFWALVCHPLAVRLLLLVANSLTSAAQCMDI